MKIERIELHYISLPFVHPFRYSSGTEVEHPCILVAVISSGLVGWGECPTYSEPIYSYETIQTAWHILSDFLIPSAIGQDLASPADVTPQFEKVRGHPMAKAGLECDESIKSPNHARWAIEMQACEEKLPRVCRPLTHADSIRKRGKTRGNHIIAEGSFGPHPISAGIQ